MRSDRRGIVLPAILSVILAMAALSSLALFEAVQEARVAGLAQDRAIARAAAMEGVAFVWAPSDLVGLCLRPPVAEMVENRPALSGGTVRLSWRHLGSGSVLAEIEGRGSRGTRHRYRAHLRPDSAGGSAGVFGCPSATRLEPAGTRWLEGHPEG